jgi:aryl-alcohol dehydrogenase-like predicted oxidoreductase
MRMRHLGRSGLRVSEVGFGSWLTIGSTLDATEATELVHRAYDLGVNLFDTADVYANGAAEELLGDALRTIPRRHVVIASKCFFPMSDDPNDGGLSRKHVVESVEASLRRLGTDYLDLHQCHRPDPDTPLAETVRTYEDLIRQGKLLYWGVSEWSASQLADACRTADATGGYRPISNQPQYSILRRRIEHEVLPVCQIEGIGQLVFSPLAQGVLSGKYGGGARPQGSRASDARVNQFMGAYLEPEVLERVDRLKPLAAELDISMAQLAIAWCLRQPSVSSVIVGATRPSQLEDNCRASEIELPAEILQQIDDLFPDPGDPPT